MREFVRSHPHYKFDSVINETINYDLLKAIDEMRVVYSIFFALPWMNLMKSCDSRERGARVDNGLLPSHMRQTNPLA